MHVRNSLTREANANTNMNNRNAESERMSQYLDNQIQSSQAVGGDSQQDMPGSIKGPVVTGSKLVSALALETGNLEARCEVFF